MLNFRGVSPNKQLKSWSLELFPSRCPDLDFVDFSPKFWGGKRLIVFTSKTICCNAFRFCRIDIDFSWFLHGTGWRSTTFSRNDLISVLGIWSFWKDHIRCVDFQEHDVMFMRVCVCVRVKSCYSLAGHPTLHTVDGRNPAPPWHVWNPVNK